MQLNYTKQVIKNYVYNLFRLEIGETPLDAAVRETLEEIGISLNKKNLKFLSINTTEMTHFTVYYTKKMWI